MPSQHNFLSFTEVSEFESDILLDNSSPATVLNDGSTSQHSAENFPEEIPDTETLENNTESLIPYTEVTQEVVYMTGEHDADILTQLQVTNNLLGIILALQVFMLAFTFLKFFIRVIKDNVTNFFT